MSIVGLLTDFGNWWLSEVRDVMPRRLQGTAANADCRLRVGRGFVRVEDALVKAGGQAEFPTREFDRHFRAWLGDRGRHRRIELVVKKGQYLERPLGTFHLPRGRARTMAIIDLQSSTPLDSADSIVVFPRFRDAGSGSRYFVLRLRTIEALIHAIERASAKLNSIILDTEHGLVEIEPADWRRLSRDSSRAAIVRKVVLAASVACLVAILATVLHAHWRFGGGLGELDNQVAAQGVAAKEVRGLIEKRRQQARQIAEIRTQKRQAIPIGRIWEELTRVVPDATWISDLSVKGGRIRVTWRVGQLGWHSHSTLPLPPALKRFMPIIQSHP